MAELTSTADGSQRNDTALLVVDVQNRVMAHAWKAEEIIARVAKAVALARQQATPVIWVQHGDDELVRDSEAWQWVPALQPASDEMLFHKSTNSAFQGTGLTDHLTATGIKHLLLCGAMTNWCIQATAYGAMERGYNLTLLGDAHTTEDLDFGHGKIIPASDVILQLNTVVNWVSYPGVSNRTLTVADCFAPRS
ncbi:MAG: isochorismatase family protein [Pseudomonadales bacterium]|nr:isochorismatase family protein [Pseudomonadales bacterium]